MELNWCKWGRGRRRIGKNESENCKYTLENWPMSHADEHANEANVLIKCYVLLEMKKEKKRKMNVCVVAIYGLSPCAPTSFSSKCNNKQYVFPSLYSDSWSNWCLSIIFFNLITISVWHLTINSLILQLISCCWWMYMQVLPFSSTQNVLTETGFIVVTGSTW